MQAMSLWDFLDGVPDDYEPKQRMTAEETEQAFLDLQNHPLFMKEIPKDLEGHPELQALQQLQYDDTAENIAISLLAKGNEVMKAHPNEKYFIGKAFEIYTDGIEQDSSNGEIMAKLFSNRALISTKRKNFKAAIQDCKWAIEKDPKFIKPYYRCAQCLYQIMHYTDALKFCDLALQISKEKEILDLKKSIELELDKMNKNKQKEEQIQETYKICASKGIRIGPCQISLPAEYQPQRLSLESIDPAIINIPILVTYPEFRQRDFIQHASENTRLIDLLEPLFKEALPWDEQQIYHLNNISCYIELDNKELAKINLKASILTIMQGEQITVKDFLEIVVVSENSNYCKQQFRQEYHIMQD